MSKLHRVFSRAKKWVLRCFGFPRLSTLEKKELSSNVPEIDDGKNIFLDMGKHEFGRNFYTFVKFFHLEGYRIFVKYHTGFFSALKSDFYASWIIEDRLIWICDQPKFVDYRFSTEPKEGFTWLTDEYFVSHDNDHGVSAIPICQHPGMYRTGQYCAAIAAREDDQGHASVFIAGNFLRRRYGRIDEEEYFDVINRIRIYDAIVSQPYTRLITVPEQLDEPFDKKVYVLDTKHFIIPDSALRMRLSQHPFFLAVPGVSLPFSHNIAEAMSVGCIPIIEKAYADLFSPALISGFNALIFEDLHALDETIRKALSLDSRDIRELRRNVLDYYQAELSPASVVSHVLSKEVKCVRLLSYTSSVKYLRN